MWTFLLALAAVVVLGASAWLLAPQITGNKAAVANLNRGRTAGPIQTGSIAPLLTRLLLRLYPASTKDRLQRALDGAGRPAGYTVEKLIALKTLGLVAGILGGVYLSGSYDGWVGFVIALAVPAFAFFVPDLLVVSRAVERRQNIQLELPELLDQMVIAVGSGMGFDQALTYVSKNFEGHLAAEMGRVGRDIQIGVPRRKAYEALAERASVDDVSRFVRAILRAGDHGVPISEVLTQQADEMRRARQRRAEAKAAQVSVKVTFPLILLIMPVLFIVILAPAIIRLVGLF